MILGYLGNFEEAKPWMMRLLVIRLMWNSRKKMLESSFNGVD